MQPRNGKPPLRRVDPGNGSVEPGPADRSRTDELVVCS